MTGRQPGSPGAGALALALICAALLAGCSREPSGAAPAAQAPGYLNQALDVAYVGMDACKDCHLGVHTTYKQTGMGRAFYPLSSRNVVEDFTSRNEIVVPDTEVRYRMYERDGRFWQRQFLHDAEGREILAEEREIPLVVGSNNHSRSYLTFVGKKMFQAPVCWYPQESKWDLCPGFEFKNEHFGREVSTDCLKCHNARMTQVPGERNEFVEPYPHGIDCERCHGPGQLHVERWSQPGAESTGERDMTIVNPRRLPVQERTEICFQCHLGDARATVRLEVGGKKEQDWRPGQRLTDYLLAFHYVEQTQWDFGISSQADRMVLSKCYTASGGKLECLSCHNPHVTVYHEDRPADHFRKKCLSCHATEACSAPMEHRQAMGGDDCVACHMRRAEPDDQRFTAFTDHWIRRSVDLAQRDHRKNFAVKPMFPEHLARYPEGEQHYYRARASFLLATDAPRVRYAEMWKEAERQFRLALDKGHDTADTWFFLGKTLGYQGRRQEALACFEKALERAPENHDAQFALGSVLMELGRADRAARVFERMVEREPANAMARAELGRSLFTLGQPAAALAHLDVAVSEEPWEPAFLTNRGMVLAALGRMGEAAAAGELAVRLDPEHMAAWNLYVNAMRESGRTAESQEGARHMARIQAAPKKEHH